MTKLRLWLAGAVLLLLLIQFIPVDRSNPPATGTIEAPDAVLSILRESCFDCHSNETRWPWYGRVAPASWLVARDVRLGREEMNFSAWKDLEPRYREKGVDEILEVVADKSMPQRRYLWLHSGAKIDEAKLAVIRRWVEDVHLR